MSLKSRTVWLYWIFAVISMAVLTLVAHSTLNYRVHPEIYYALGAAWTLFISGLVFALYRKDFEIEARLQAMRFADASAALVSELRKVIASILESHTEAQVDAHSAAGVRMILNIAHEFFSFVTREHCTANLAIIAKSGKGDLVCKVIEYDDFVPNARREKEVKIPFAGSLFEEIRDRGLNAVVIDDYRATKYPVRLVPIIEAGYCVSGICAPVRLFDSTTAFFNVDSTKRNIFRPNGDERVATFFAELLGQLFQVADFRSREIRNEGETEVRFD